MTFGMNDFNRDDENELVDNVIVLPVNEESKKIRQILSNETSVRILSELQEKSLSASDLSEILSIPLNTVLYNLNILIENELVFVKKIKYSEKGREIKIYEAPQKAIIFVPETSSKSSLIALIKQYASVLVLSLGIGFVFRYLYYYLSKPKGLALKSIPESASDSVISGTESFKHTLDAASRFDYSSLLLKLNDLIYTIFAEELFWFFLGSLFTIILLLIVHKLNSKKS